MKKMNIEDAVNYCLGHKAVIHTPTQDTYNSLMEYLKRIDMNWFEINIFNRYKSDTGVNVILSTGCVMYCDIPWYIENGYEIIELSSVSIDGISYSNKDKAISKIESIFSSFPSAGDTYYYIKATADVSCDTWDDHEIDKKRLAIGNIYKTKEEAESALDRVIKAYKG